jgi:hypothetical protein
MILMCVAAPAPPAPAPVAPEETEEERKHNIEMKRLATSKMLLARKGLAAKGKQQGVCSCVCMLAC